MDESDLNELHRLLAILQGIDVGVVMLDLDLRVKAWNSFMENHSGRSAAQASGQSFFELFPEVPQLWFRRKVESVLTLGTPAFTVWEQRPYVVRFKNYQPILGQEPLMFQNTTLMPVVSINSETQHVCLIIYDVTSVAVNRRQLLEANAQLEQLSRTDRLTGLSNRGHWEEELKRQYARHRRYGSMASLIMFDIDHFKRINDTYGHQAGDRVIQTLARITADSIRDADLAGRYGGEEFAVLLPDVSAPGARLLAERLRKTAEATEVMHEGQSIRFTISIGVADLSEPCASHEHLIQRADHALYASKHAGRNRITVHGC
ncbi:sensor domain-containing diguanylate cyclase [Stutzerimonas tarimensis]|uniref:diguanylate cyclase n=1 Tax=Stutzerimonas tarimensis TaxID=1507735 RepID=A0ABV7T495_9GAMM